MLDDEIQHHHVVIGFSTILAAAAAAVSSSSSTRQLQDARLLSLLPLSAKANLVKRALWGLGERHEWSIDCIEPARLHAGRLASRIDAYHQCVPAVLIAKADAAMA